MHYELLKQTGALKDGGESESVANAIVTSWSAEDRSSTQSANSGEIVWNRIEIPPAVLERIPPRLARESCVIPLAFDGERLTVAAATPDRIALADKLRSLLACDIQLVAAPAASVRAAIDRLYASVESESVDSMLCEFTDTAIEFDADEVDETTRQQSFRPAGRTREFKRGPNVQKTAAIRRVQQVGAPAKSRRLVPLNTAGATSMLFYTVPEGQRVIMTDRNGAKTVLIGPQRLWRGSRRFEPMRHAVAHPGEFLIVRFRDGTQQNLAGPAELWLDPRLHEDVTNEDALQIAAKEAVVVYSRSIASAGTNVTARRVVHGPTLFVPQPGEWLHKFSWHASQGGSQGVEKTPNGLIFQKLWLMPDQMYHNVHDVRTSDDAVLTIRLMLFFELMDIDRMLDSTHDPIGDFVNAATADVVEFTVKHNFESFKQNTHQLNELATYKTMASRAAQIGYRIANVVYRGYGAAESLQRMHNQAIEARTKLQLDRATDEQAQVLENFKLDGQLARATKRRAEQTDEVRHDLELNRQKAEADLAQLERTKAVHREQQLAEARVRDETERQTASRQQQHLQALKELGVNLTEYLTQSRADRVIELRGAGATHVHVDPQTRS